MSTSQTREEAGVGRELTGNINSLVEELQKLNVGQELIIKLLEKLLDIEDISHRNSVRIAITDDDLRSIVHTGNIDAAKKFEADSIPNDSKVRDMAGLFVDGIRGSRSGFAYEDLARPTLVLGKYRFSWNPFAPNRRDTDGRAVFSEEQKKRVSSRWPHVLPKLSDYFQVEKVCYRPDGYAGPQVSIVKHSSDTAPVVGEVSSIKAEGGVADALPSQHWDQIVFGTVQLHYGLRGYLGLDSLALFLHQITAAIPRKIRDPEQDSNLEYRDGITVDLLHDSALKFILSYAGEWLPGGGTQHTYLAKWIHIQHHFRFLKVKTLKVEPDIDKVRWHGSGDRLTCLRPEGTLILPSGQKVKGLQIGEERWSIALNTTRTLELPLFTLSILDDWRHGVFSGFVYNLEKVEWDKANLQPGRVLKGVSILQMALFKAIDGWSESWTDTLVAIHDSIEAEPNTILHRPSRRNLMFDDPSLKISEHYFAVLQILRTMGEWIAESIEDIEDMKQTWDTWQKEWLPVWRVAGVSEEMKIEDGETIALNWAVLASRQRNLGKKLLDKIDRTTEEVKLLRDGLFNATSVQEATRGGRINQAIFVFTIMTIFYLPLTFASSIFGMHLFDSSNPGKTQSNFYITTVLIAVVTYIFSGLAVWWVSESERREKLTKEWALWDTWIRQELNSKKKKDSHPSSGRRSEEQVTGDAEKQSNFKIFLDGLRHRKKEGIYAVHPQGDSALA